MPSPSMIQNERASNFEFPARYSVETAAKKLLTPIQFIGFWSAIALPLGYLPFLYGDHLAPSVEVLGPLLVLNLIAMLIGHGYKSD